MYALVIGCPIFPLMSSSGFSPKPQPLGKGRPWYLGVLQCENLTPTYPLQGSSTLITTPLWMSEPRSLFPWFRQGRGTISGIPKDKPTQIEKSRHLNGDNSMCQVEIYIHSYKTSSQPYKGSQLTQLYNEKSEVQRQ